MCINIILIFKRHDSLTSFMYIHKKNFGELSETNSSPTTWGKSWCWMAICEPCPQIWCSIGSWYWYFQVFRSLSWGITFTNHIKYDEIEDLVKSFVLHKIVYCYIDRCSVITYLGIGNVLIKKSWNILQWILLDESWPMVIFLEVTVLDFTQIFVV